jgi:hypothetical protein
MPCPFAVGLSQERLLNPNIILNNVRAMYKIIDYRYRFQYWYLPAVRINLFKESFSIGNLKNLFLTLQRIFFEV